MGIEPTQSAWKAEVLPLNYTRVTLKGLIETRHYKTFNNGGGGRIRTSEGIANRFTVCPF